MSEWESNGIRIVAAIVLVQT